MPPSPQLQHLLTGPYSCIFIPTFEEREALDMIAASAGGAPVSLWSCINGIDEDPFGVGRLVPQTENPAAALLKFRGAAPEVVCVTLDLLDHATPENPLVLRGLRDLIDRFAMFGRRLVMIDHRSELPAVLRQYVVRFEIPLPDGAEIVRTFKDAARGVPGVRVDKALTEEMANAAVQGLCGLTRRQIRQVAREAVADRHLTPDDLPRLLSRKREFVASGGLLEFVDAPTDMEQIGGLANLKRWLAQRAGADPGEAKKFGLVPPRGVLMLGVQGAGKSLCAKAIATAWRRPLLRMDPGTLYDRYVGESERRLRDALAQADAMAPIVLWIDEIEKAFASAASHSTDGGLSQRMFGTLLTWMQEHDSSVFVAATANNIDALPPELLRKGRFDEIFFVDLPGPEARRQILTIHLRRRGRDAAAFDLDALVTASDGYSGAEIEQGIQSALRDAFVQPEPARRVLETGGLIAALRRSPPLSVIRAGEVALLREWARTRCVPAE